MRFRVVQTHRRGVPLDRKALHCAAGFVGELLTFETTHDRRRGSILVAQLVNAVGGSQDDQLIPRLYEPVLQVLSIQGLLITGYEQIGERDSIAEYVQGWWARQELRPKPTLRATHWTDRLGK